MDLVKTKLQYNLLLGIMIGILYSTLTPGMRHNDITGVWHVFVQFSFECVWDMISFSAYQYQRPPEATELSTFIHSYNKQEK